MLPTPPGSSTGPSEDAWGHPPELRAVLLGCRLFARVFRGCRDPGQQAQAAAYLSSLVHLGRQADRLEGPQLANAAVG